MHTVTRGWRRRNRQHSVRFVQLDVAPLPKHHCPPHAKHTKHHLSVTGEVHEWENLPWPGTYTEDGKGGVTEKEDQKIKQNPCGKLMQAATGDEIAKHQHGSAAFSLPSPFSHFPGLQLSACTSFFSTFIALRFAHRWY